MTTLRRLSMTKLPSIFNALRRGIARTIDCVEKNSDKVVFVFIFFYVVVFSGYTIFMHYVFKTYAWDLGIFTQSFWTTVNRGKLFYYTVELNVNPSGSFFGTHFSPILFLVLPIYAIFQSPYTLLVLQTIVLALGALPVYWIAKKALDDKLSAVGMAAAYLIYPAVQSVNCFDFHTEAFIPLFFLLTFYYISEQKWFKGLLFAVLTLSTIEFAPILIMFLAFYLILKDAVNRIMTRQWMPFLRRLLFPIMLMIIAVAWFFLASYVVDVVNPVKSTGLPGNWTYWGSSLSGVVVNIITHPLQALAFMATPTDKVFYVFGLLAPLLILPVFSPEILFALPWLIAAPLSEYGFYYNLYFQYSAFAIGQLFIAAIFCIRRFSFLNHDKRKNFKIQRVIISSILIASFLLSVAISPIGLPRLGARPVNITPHTNLVHDILNMVPGNASVATQNDIFPHVAQREDAYILTWPMPMEVDFILVDMKSSHFYSQSGFSSNVTVEEALEKEVETGNYGLLASADGILLFQKGYNGPLTLFDPRKDVFGSDSLFVLNNSKILGDPTSSSGKTIVHEAGDSLGVIWYGPYSYFFSGEYQATFRMKTNSESLRCVIDVANSGTAISSRTVNSSDLKPLGEWNEVTLDFKIDGVGRMEFRGFCESNNTYVSLDYVKITQVGL